jgi:hypothetical protein
MACPKCQARNREGRKFCTACEAVNEPGDSCCSDCSLALTGEAPKRTPHPSSSPSTPSPIQPVSFANGRYQVKDSFHAFTMFQEESNGGPDSRRF